MATSPLNALKDDPVPSEIGGDEDYSAKYVDALNKINQTLNNRTSQPMNWFSVAGALLKPGRTGNAGEAISNAADVVGAQVERQRQEELPVAQMKAEILGKQYQVGRQLQGNKILASILGTDPSTARESLSSGNVPAGISRLANGKQLAALTYYDKDAGAALKSGIEVEQKQMENAIKLLDSGVDVSKATANMSEDQKKEFLGNIDAYRTMLGIPGPRSGTTSTLAPVSATPTTATVAATGNNGSGIGYQPGKGYATYDSPQKWASANDELTSQYLTPRQGQAPMTPERFVGTWVTGDPTAGPLVQNGDYVKAVKSELANAGVALNADGSIPNTPEARQAVAIAQVKHETAPKQQGPFLEALGATRPVAPQGPRSYEDPKAYQERMKLLEEPQIKDAAEVASGLSKIDTDSLTTSNADLNELKKIAAHPSANKIFAPLQLQGGETYAQAATKVAIQQMKEGAQVTAGSIHAGVGVNFEPVYQNLKLTPEEKVMSARAQQIIAQQVINNIIANKTKAFGGSRVTNYQDQQLSALNANMNQLPKFIGGWATRRQVDNAALLDAQNEYVNFQRNALKANRPADPREFILSDTYLKDLPRRHKEQVDKVNKFYGEQE